MSKTAVEQLIAVHLLERTSSDDLVWRLTYPSICDEDREYLAKKCGHENDGKAQNWTFRYNHFGNSWNYLHTFPIVSSSSRSLEETSSHSIVVIQANEFNPEKYQTLARLLAKVYKKTGQPNQVLNTYLSVVIQGSCDEEENGSFSFNEFEQRKVMAFNCSIKQVINMFKLDVILIYTALILRKRIAVYHHKLENLLQFVRTVPAFLWHRQDWDEIVYPVVDLNLKSEVDQLLEKKQYVAGFVDNQIESRADLYDVYVNLAAVEITVATHARDTFGMTKTHKEIAVFISRQAENESATQIEVIQEISNKTNELINNLKSFATTSDSRGQAGTLSPVLTLDLLQERKLAPALESFLWNLAIAENLN